MSNLFHDLYNVNDFQFYKLIILFDSVETFIKKHN